MTRRVGETLERRLDLREFLEASLERSYSANPDEVFSTGLGAWLRSFERNPTRAYLEELRAAYGTPRLTIENDGYLLGIHPLAVWCTGEISSDPSMPWETLEARSAEARRVSIAWLFRTSNRRAQDLRLRIRFEQDAFAQLTPAWRFEGVVFAPSLEAALREAAGHAEGRAREPGPSVASARQRAVTSA